jgi:hypothetical protein
VAVLSQRVHRFGSEESAKFVGFPASQASEAAVPPYLQAGMLRLEVRSRATIALQSLLLSKDLIVRLPDKYRTKLNLPDKPCRFKRSMQHSSILLIQLCFSKRPDPLGSIQLNLDRAVFSLNQCSRTNLAVQTSADWISGRSCVDPLKPPG